MTVAFPKTGRRRAPRLAVLTCAALLAASPALAQESPPPHRHHHDHGQGDHQGRDHAPAPLPPASYKADILGEGGAVIGSAQFDQGPSGVLIELSFKAGALTPGWHGAHFHEKAECGDAGFKLSGGHVGHDVAAGRHGLLNPNGPEFGDLPSFFVPESGAFAVQLFSSRVVLGKEAIGPRGALLDADGSALVIHAGRDDQITQPIGGAGARVACAALK